jgi:nucleoside 2-deoxyribosyltransferase
MDSAEEEIIDGIATYTEKMETRKMLEEYMRRLIVEQPKEPLKFLIKEITTNPYPVPNVGVAANEEKAA